MRAPFFLVRPTAPARAGVPGRAGPAQDGAHAGGGAEQGEPGAGIPMVSTVEDLTQWL